MGFLDFLKKQPAASPSQAAPSSPSSFISDPSSPPDSMSQAQSPLTQPMATQPMRPTAAPQYASPLPPPPSPPPDPIMTPVSSRWDRFPDNDISAQAMPLSPIGPPSAQPAVQSADQSANPFLASLPPLPQSPSQRSMPQPSSQPTPSTLAGNDEDYDSIPLPPQPKGQATDFLDSITQDSAPPASSSQTPSQASSPSGTSLPQSQQSAIQTIELPDFTEDDVATAEEIATQAASATDMTSSANATPAARTPSIPPPQWIVSDLPPPLPPPKDEIPVNAGLRSAQSQQWASQSATGRQQSPSSITIKTEQRLVASPANAMARPQEEIILPIGEQVQPERIEPAKFISSKSHFMILDENRSLRRTLRQNDEILKNGLLAHEQLDALCKRVSLDINNIQEQLIKMDEALFTD